MLGQGICKKFQSRDGISLTRWTTETCKLEYPHSWERRYNNNHLTKWHMSKAFYGGNLYLCNLIELIKKLLPSPILYAFHTLSPLVSNSKLKSCDMPGMLFKVLPSESTLVIMSTTLTLTRNCPFCLASMA